MRSLFCPDLSQYEHRGELGQRQNQKKYLSEGGRRNYLECPISKSKAASSKNLEDAVAILDSGLLHNFDSKHSSNHSIDVGNSS